MVDLFYTVTLKIYHQIRQKSGQSGAHMTARKIAVVWEILFYPNVPVDFAQLDRF